MLNLKTTHIAIMVLAVVGLLCAAGTTFGSEAGMAASQPQLDQPREGGGLAAPVADMADTAGGSGADSSAFTKPAGSGGTGKAASPAKGQREVYKPVQDGEGDRK